MLGPMETGPDDLERRAAAGDRDALGALLEAHLPALRAYVRRRAGPEIGAQEWSVDLVQSVCREVLQHADRFQHASESSFQRWLFTTAMRKLLDRRVRLRAEKRDARREQGDAADHGLASPAEAPDVRAELAEEIARIEEALDGLEPGAREVFLLAHVEGLSRSEIGQRIGKSEGAVRMALHRAVARLGVLLRET